MKFANFIALLRCCAVMATALWTALLAGCGVGTPWNSPYPSDELRGNVMFAAFDARPKHLDPARSYSANEYRFIGQIYEPPLQYHYLIRPYTLIPATVEAMPRAVFFDGKGRQLPDDAPPQSVAYTVYDIHIIPGIRYQPHPAFAVDAAGKPLYQNLSAPDLEQVNTLADFTERGSRELIAADYVYQIKRLAHPQLHSPIVGLMSDYIVGMKEYQKTLQQAFDQLKRGGEGEVYLDLDRYPLEGATVVDRYTYRIKIRGSLSPVSLLAGHAVFCAHAQGSGSLLFPARHGREKYHSRLVSGRHRALHADGQQSQPPNGAGAQSQFPR